MMLPIIAFGPHKRSFGIWSRAVVRLGVVKPFMLADIGEGITQVEVMEWHVKPGDRVEEMDRLCTVESDKAAVEITSRYSGIVKRLLFDVNSMAKVGDVLLEIEDENEEGNAAAMADTKPVESSTDGRNGDSHIVQFHLADIGEGISEVLVTEWHVSEGDRVEEMDNLCTVESDKAVVDITSRYNGVIKRLGCKAGETAKVGSVLVDIEVVGGQEDCDVVEEKADTLGKLEVSESIKNDGERSLAIPMVRKLAKDKGININDITGSGPDGRVTMDDVLKASSSSLVVEPETSPEVAMASNTSGDTSYRVSLTSGLAAAMVKSMTASLAVPHLSLGEEICVDELLRVQSSLKHKVRGPPHNLPSVTLTAFMIKALSLCLLKHERLNSKIDPSGEFFTVYRHHNVSIAIDGPTGLMVPNIKHVEKKSLIQIQKDILDLQARATAGRLTLDDVRGGTVSFSNVGVIGGTYPRPVLFDGQGIIGAVGRILTIPRFTSDGSEVYPAKILTISWSADHRHIDGASVARFSNTFKGYLEDPSSMILETA